MKVPYGRSRVLSEPEIEEERERVFCVFEFVAADGDGAVCAFHFYDCGRPTV